MVRKLIVLILLCSSQANAEDLIAVLDLKFIKDTGETAALLCFGDAQEDCGTWATFYLYEARIRKVISGDFSSGKIMVKYGRHALIQRNLKNVVASLSKLTDQQDAEYQIMEWGEFREMYCFSGEFNQPSNVSEITGGQQLKCFEEK